MTTARRRLLRRSRSSRNVLLCYLPKNKPEKEQEREEEEEEEEEPIYQFAPIPITYIGKNKNRKRTMVYNTNPYRYQHILQQATAAADRAVFFWDKMNAIRQNYKNRWHRLITAEVYNGAHVVRDKLATILQDHATAFTKLQFITRSDLIAWNIHPYQLNPGMIQLNRNFANRAIHPWVLEDDASRPWQSHFIPPGLPEAAFRQRIAKTYAGKRHRYKVRSDDTHETNDIRNTWEDIIRTLPAHLVPTIEELFIDLKNHQSDYLFHPKTLAILEVLAMYVTSEKINIITDAHRLQGQVLKPELDEPKQNITALTRAMPTHTYSIPGTEEEEKEIKEEEEHLNK